ncbi:COX15/CtaA family protein [Wenzhouxiangella sp. AB-CW3]|uniref:COX15/CtaA family protein n=1 Tax=Wenzhouxiangella sp. AB-CW3 TaxID=2771012 RepID=UPI00168AB81B|nr:COX15/CtaA family protein [Wenzhouxiangella sp. AB-CW3]QOC22507.1 COX15/CtaA family protein [Wenzhouxiangella sp. AB-CW3]
MNFIERRNERILGRWLMACCLVLLILVIVGGATRLTGSGLSMVEWQPLTVIPPMNEESWMAEFDAYRASPEYQKINYGMSLSEFKVIYWWEFGHRLLARGLGLVFALPLLFFWVRGMVPVRLRWPLLGLLALGGFQGWLGWYMVQSGLVDIPRVSPYRLAAHLGVALVIFAIMFRLALSLLWPGPRRPAPRRWRPWTIALLAMVSVTIIWGAFVAGLNAGLVYNTFPLMAGQWIPHGILGLEPTWRNLFENTATVQFIHRVLAVVTFVIALVAWLRVWKREPDARIRWTFHALFAVVAIQVGLGIATLLTYVPVTLGTIHQGVAVLVLAAVIGADYLADRDPSGERQTAHETRLTTA